jgi:membrane protease YdiL (CAAX protease family)
MNGALILLGLLALFILHMGWRRGFLRFTFEPWEVPLRFPQLIGAFAIYFLVTIGASTTAIAFLKSQILGNYLGFTSWLNFILSSAIFLALLLYWRCLPKRVRIGILFRERPFLQEDVKAAFYAWLLSFPLVLFLSQTLELIISHYFQITQLPDQVAVHFLKSTFDSPLYFILAVLSITVLAPLVEETLFRGFLQTFIRQHLGSKNAIVITAVCFSLFHYSAGQGLGNISIICSLFILALFLGYLYEKQGSLFASMVLHSTFNTISVLNLYLFGVNSWF